MMHLTQPSKAEETKPVHRLMNSFCVVVMVGKSSVSFGQKSGLIGLDNTRSCLSMLRISELQENSGSLPSSSNNTA